MEYSFSATLRDAGNSKVVTVPAKTIEHANLKEGEIYHFIVVVDEVGSGGM